MRVLLVKTSSFGDIIHCFPALTIASKLVPELRCDWLARPLYQSLLALQPNVASCLQQPRLAAMRRARQFTDRSPRGKYDLLIDAQGLLRSATVARCYPAQEYAGYSWASAREPVASLLYSKRYRVSVNQHAVQRNINLLAQALGLAKPATLPHLGDYGLRLPLASNGRIALACNTSNARKCWNSAGWQELIKIIAAAGQGVFLPWGSDAERDYCTSLAQAAPDVCHVPEQRLDFSMLAQELAQCSGLIGLDTGVSHLAAALGLPVLALYFVTAPELCGVWSPRALNLALEPRHFISRAQRSAWPHLDSSNNYHGNLNIRTTDSFQAPELWQLLQKLQNQ